MFCDLFTCVEWALSENRGSLRKVLHSGQRPCSLVFLCCGLFKQAQTLASLPGIQAAPGRMQCGQRWPCRGHAGSGRLSRSPELGHRDASEGNQLSGSWKCARGSEQRGPRKRGCMRSSERCHGSVTEGKTRRVPSSGIGRAMGGVGDLACPSWLAVSSRQSFQVPGPCVLVPSHGRGLAT